MLACLIQSRTNDEQRALIAWAWTCDREHNKLTSGNAGAYEEPWNLVGHVHDTRVLEEGDKLVPTPKRWGETWETWKRERPAWIGDADPVAVRGGN